MKKLLFIAVGVLLAVRAYSQTMSDTTTKRFSLSFIPDWTFKGATLDEWKRVGKGDWTVQNGELVGKASSADATSWLVLNQSFQDVGFHALFKCSKDSETGILFRMEQTAEGFNGVLLSIKADEVAPYQVTLDTNGQELGRTKLRYAGSIFYRLAPPESDKDRPSQYVSRGKSPEVPLPVARPSTEFRQQDWNQLEVFFDLNVIRSFLNQGREIGGASDESFESYGPIALLAKGNEEVRFKEVGVKDLANRITPTEKSSSRFNVQRISDMYYSWGADAADFDRDGNIDVVSGPNIFFGPDFTRHREIFPAIAVSPSKEFTEVNAPYSYDFNHDGWPDILVSPMKAVLYINPQKESRRWESYEVVPAVQSEITDFKDIDNDGIPELIYAAEGTMRYAKPNPTDPTKPWIEHIISEVGYGVAHGIGTGDINGDGRLDILNPYGWWEQPADLIGNGLWAYHPVAFSDYGHGNGGLGGSIMAVYDVNGDGLNDVVTSLNAHGFGLAWFEQQRKDRGEIKFVKHMINDDYSVHSAGGVTFSQQHGATFADIDQDGIPDFIVGKRYFTHLDNFFDPDPYGPPVLYWYRTVRNPDAPGGAEFIPELIHNRSGAGSEVTAIDINKDGAVDIISATNRGTFIFWNKPKDK